MRHVSLIGMSAGREQILSKQGHSRIPFSFLSDEWTKKGWTGNQSLTWYFSTDLFTVIAGKLDAER